jgi:putative transposase
VPSAACALYRRHRFPAEVISHAVWLYFRFNLGFRDVEELLAERGVQVSYETIRRLCAKFGPVFALQLQRRRARPGDKWHLDEVAIRICGHRHWLWRAVDQHGVVLDILVQSRRANMLPSGSCAMSSTLLATSRESSSPTN